MCSLALTLALKPTFWSQNFVLHPTPSSNCHRMFSAVQPPLPVSYHPTSLSSLSHPHQKHHQPDNTHHHQHRWHFESHSRRAPSPIGLVPAKNPCIAIYFFHLIDYRLADVDKSLQEGGLWSVVLVMVQMKRGDGNLRLLYSTFRIILGDGSR